MKSRADLVILDAPPVLAVTDALVLGARADGVIFVVSLLKSDKNADKRSLEALEALMPRCLGRLCEGFRTTRADMGAAITTTIITTITTPATVRMSHQRRQRQSELETAYI